MLGNKNIPMKRAIIILLLSFPILILAQDRYWVGSGNWSDTANWSAASGGTSGASVPTASNNVFFDANSSGTVTVDVDGNAASISFAGTPGITFTGSAARNLTINGSFTLSANVTNSYLGQITFAGSTGGSITSAGILIQSELLFSGTGNWTLQDDLTTNKDITVDNGTFTINGNTLNTGELGSNSASSMTIDMSNSNVHLSKFFQGATNMNIIASNSTLFLDGSVPELRDVNNQTLHRIIFTDANATGQVNSSTGNTFHAIDFMGDGQLNGSHTIDTIYTHDGKTLSLGAGETQTILDIVAIGGCTSFITINSTVAGSQANISKSGDNLILEQVNLQDINATGGAIFTAENSIDLGNNTGWTINIGRDIYWVGGSGNWEDSAHWSTTSGGTPGACSPGQFDNVFFDGNSFSADGETVKLSTGDGLCHNMDWSAIDQNVQFTHSSTSYDIFIHGSLFLDQKLDIVQNINIFMESGDLGEGILSNGYIYDQTIYFQGTGEWNLLDDMDGSRIIHNNGTFNTNNHLVDMYNWTGAAAATVNIGSSNVIINGSGGAGFSYTVGSTVQQNNSHIYLQNSGGVVRTYNTNLNYIEYSQTGSLGGSNTSIDSLIASDTFTISAPSNSISWMDLRADATFAQNFEVDTLLLAPGGYYTMNGNNTVNINDSLRAVSNCTAGYLQIRGTSTSFTYTLNAPFQVKVDFARLENITATGATNFLANNSVDMGGNTGWTFDPDPLPTRTLYWVGGATDWEWNDPGNWSLASGGTTGECVPWLTDNVIFDDNSFSGADDDVIVDADDAYFHDMTWTVSSGDHQLRAGAQNASKVFQSGSLQLSSVVTIGSNGHPSWDFISTDTNETIQSNGGSFATGLLFNGTATYDQQDALNNTHTTTFNTGTYNTNGHNFNTGWLTANSGATLNLGTSTVTSGCTANFNTGNLTADQSTVIINSSGCAFNSIAGNAFGAVLFPNGGSLNGPECTFNLVEFTGAGSARSGTQGKAVYNTLTFHDNGNISGNGNTMGTLNFAAGKEYTFAWGNIADTIGTWNAVSTCQEGYIDIKSNTTTSQATVYSPNNQTLDIVRLKNMAVASDSPGTFTANNSVDNLGNTIGTPGWIFNSTPRSLYWVPALQDDGVTVSGTGLFSESKHWSLTSGGTGGECVPTLIDDIYFDANSFNGPGQSMSIDEETSVHSMIWDNVDPGATWSNSNFNLNIFGSLVLDSNMAYQYQRNIRFNNKTPDIDSLKTENVTTFNNLIFNGDGTYNLVDSLKNNSQANLGDLRINDDITFNANGEYFAARYIDIDDNVTLNMVGSTAEVGPYSIGSFYVENGVTVNADQSTVNVLGVAGSFSAGNHTFFDLNYPNSLVSGSQVSLNCTSCTFRSVDTERGLRIIGNNTMDSLFFAPGFIYTFQAASNTTINDQWDASGDCAGDNLSTVQSSSSNQATIHTVNFVPAVSDAKISGLIGSSDVTGNPPFDGSGSYDLGNNTNWDFSSTATARDLYWVGDSGEWYEGSHWALTSGGPGGQCPPFGNDNVFFDANSFNSTGQTVSIQSAAFCNNMDWSGSGTDGPRLALLSPLTIGGSLTFDQGVLTSGGSWTITFSGDDTESIIMNNVDHNTYMNFTGGGTWNLQDDLLMHGHQLTITNGTLNTNDNDIFLWRLMMTSGTDPKTLNLGNSVIHCSNSVDVSGSNVTLNAGTSNILFDLGSGTKYLYTGLGNTFYNVLFTVGNTFNNIYAPTNTGNDATFNNVTFEGNGNLSGSFAYNDLTLSAGHNYSFRYDETQTFLGDLIANGTCDDRISIQSSSTNVANPTTFLKNGADVNVESIDINNIHATGTATFNANNATEVNTMGWNIVNGNDAVLYWVGGTGSWDDRSHWSYTSGGAGGACEPGQNNSVVFDANSFTAAGQTVTIPSNAICNSMTWTSGMTPELFGNDLQDLQIYGSLELETGMNFNFAGDVFFESLMTGNTITSNGHTIPGDQVIFQGIGGGWSLLDDMRIDGDLLLRNGTLDINDSDIVFTQLVSINNTPRSLLLGNGQIVVTGEGDVWDLNPTSLTFDAGMSHIYFTGTNVQFDPNSNFTYYDVTFNELLSNILLRGPNCGSSEIINSDNVTFNNVTFECDGQIFGGHTYNDLTFSPGHSYVLESAKVQTINGAMNIEGTSGNRVTIIATTAGTTGILAPSDGPFCLRWLNLTDNEIQGFTYAAGNSIDGGGNVNWDFASTLCGPLPVELTYFNADVVDRKVRLTWQTATETNNNFFTIERSIDAVNWEFVLEKDGAGNSSVAIEYEDWDNNPYFGRSYYRLKQTDFDGSFEYFDIREVFIDQLEEVRIYPNPVRDILLIEGVDAELKDIRMFNSVGQQISIRPEKTINGIRVNLDALANGMYFIHLKDKAYQVVKH